MRDQKERINANMTYYSDSNDENISFEIIKALRDYNIVDILLKVSALNLLPYNQNKSIVFDSIINDILTHEVGSYKSENYISMSKFKNLIKNYRHSDISMIIDPAEMPFIQRVQFFGDYWIFPGINTSIGYNLQKLINVIFRNTNSFNKDFKNKCYLMIRTILSISNSIIEDLGYGIDTLDHYKQPEVDIPSSNRLKELSEHLVVDVELIYEILQDDADILFYNNDNYSDFLKYESITNYLFFYSPFLKITDTDAIILNPTMLPTFLVYYILYTAKEYDAFHDVVTAYNNEVWRDCKRHLKLMGHNLVDAEAEGVELFNTESYKEGVFTVSDSRLLFVRFFCDDGHDYDCMDMFTSYAFNNDHFNNRWEYIQKSFNKCNSENFYSLSIISTFGRGMSVGFTEDCKKSLHISPFELECIFINEWDHANFIARYLDSKSKIQTLPFDYGDMDAISLYTSNGYSFYYSDDININETFFMPGIGDAVDYLNDAIKKEDRQLVPFPKSRYIKEIILTNKKRKIYRNTQSKNREYIVRFSNVDIWVCGCEPTSIGKYNMVNSILDLITYWLGELRSTIEKLSFFYETIVINTIISEEVTQFFSEEPSSEGYLSDNLSFDNNGETLSIQWSQQAIQNLVAKDNSREKELICLILEKLSECYSGDVDYNEIEKCFENPLKKKIFTLDVSTNPYLKPTYSEDRIIPVEYVNELLDKIGQFALLQKKIPYGVIADSDKAPLCMDIVSFLYEMLKEKVACLDGNRLCKLCYLDLENVMCSMMTAQKRFSYDVACYPEEAEKYYKSFNDNNQLSVALKFLIEYVTATQPTGKEYFGEIEYENLLTICSFIIEWAYNKDLFDNKIVNSKVEMLKSQRIGIDKTQIHRITNYQRQAYNIRLSSRSNPNIDIFSPKYYADYIPEIDVAFTDEYGYSFTQLFTFVQALIDVGNGISADVKIMKSYDVIEKVEQVTDLKSKTIQMIIRDTSLVQREDYTVPPAGYSTNDIWPWRFNRRLSFTRRPIIIYDDELIWGNRQLSHSLWFTLDLLFDGKYKASGEKLKSLIGKISNKRGNTFNDDVKQKLESIQAITVYSKVKKVNGKWITSSDNNTLGDIDILIINNLKHRIIVGEVKDFSFTKSSYEMYQEYQKVFCDNGSNLCFVSKHKRRVQWIKEHINDVIKHYNLPKGNWSVRDVFITNEVIVSNEVYHKNQNILLYSEINEKRVNKL